MPARALFLALLPLLPVSVFAAERGRPVVTPRADGFRGIWFDLGQKSEYGSKYSGGLGTYTANHVPMAHYSEKTNRTYFTWGGAPSPGGNTLQIPVSYYDHSNGTVACPVIVMDKAPVDDPHDNASLCIDGEGHLWIFVSGRSKLRPGRVFRTAKPHDIGAWLDMGGSEFTYPQPWWFGDKGFFHTYTRYTPGRELYFRTSPDGIAWSTEKKLAGLEGHYQTSARIGGRLITAFNRHPGRNVDRRTDLHYMETADMGGTWTTAGGEKIGVPVTKPGSPARIRNYASENLNVYIHDTTADADGRPAILYLTSRHHQPGPQGDPRTWRVARWTGTDWLFHDITTSTHNYDTGSLFIDKDGTWQVIGPTGAGPQKWGCGGEIEMWVSADRGATWKKHRELTKNSPRNHSYVRRPQNAHPDFHAYWADGDADKPSESHLYLTNRSGDKVWKLPYTMTGDFAAPEPLEP